MQVLPDVVRYQLSQYLSILDLFSLCVADSTWWNFMMKEETRRLLIVRLEEMQDFYFSHQYSRDVCRFLLAIRAVDPYTMLKDSIPQGRCYLVQMILSRSNLSRTGLERALELAVRSGIPKMVEIVLNSGVVPDTASTLLAVQEDHEEILELLLQSGADPDSHNITGYTALTYCIWWGNLRIFKLLIQYGADVNLAQEESKHTPLYIACLRQRYEMIELLLKKGANPNLVNKYNRVSITEAIRYTDRDVISRLIQAGSDLNYIDYEGDTPLIYAVRIKDHSIVQELLDHGANVNFQSPKDGETALFQAVRLHSLKVIECLLKGGANPQLMNRQEQTALDLAYQYDFQDVVDLLNRETAMLISE